MATQPTTEIKFVYDYWVANLAPKGFIDNAANADTMVEEMIRLNLANPVTFTRLTEVCKALGVPLVAFVKRLEGKLR